MAPQNQRWQFYIVYEMGDCFDPEQFYTGLRDYPELKESLVLKMIPLPVRVGRLHMPGSFQMPTLLTDLPDSFQEYENSFVSVDMGLLGKEWSGPLSQKYRSYRIVIARRWWREMVTYMRNAQMESVAKLFAVSNASGIRELETFDWLTQVDGNDIAQRTTLVLHECVKLFSEKLGLELTLPEGANNNSDLATTASNTSDDISSAQNEIVSEPGSNTLQDEERRRVDPPKWKERPWQEGDRQAEIIQTSLGWSVVGVSRIGKMHIQQDGVREDAFAIESFEGWSLIAVADGGGSYKYAAHGSKLAVEAAVQSMKMSCQNIGERLLNNSAQIKEMLQLAIRSAWTAIDDEARQRRLVENENITRRDFSTTLLLLAHHPDGYVGVAQIGDGLIAAQMQDGSISFLGRPESGEYASETSFLPRSELGQILDKNIQLYQPKAGVRAILVMTDGVADDFYPYDYEKRVPSLLDEVYLRLHESDAENTLLSLLDYEMRTSFDDRTLVVLFEPKNLEEKTAVQARIEQRKALFKAEKDKQILEAK